MENKKYKPYPFLPRLLFLVCLMALPYTQIHLGVHVFVFSTLHLYEVFLLPKNLFRKSFLTQIPTMAPFFLVLFVFYAIFLQIGQTVLYEVSISSKLTWTLYSESIVYAAHYLFLFFQTFWVSFLIFHEKKIEKIQYFFYGSLFPLTLIWNGSISQVKQMMTCKNEFDQSIKARGVEVKKKSYVLKFFQYAISNILRSIEKRMPGYKRVWKNKANYKFHWAERWIWLIPILFLLCMVLRNELGVHIQLKIQLLILLVGLAMLYLIVRNQYEEMTPPQRWASKDVVISLLLLVWLVYQIYMASNLFSYQLLDYWNLLQWLSGNYISIIFLSGAFLTLRRKSALQ